MAQNHITKTVGPLPECGRYSKTETPRSVSKKSENINEYIHNSEMCKRSKKGLLCKTKKAVSAYM